jgi:hypothetical protein
MVVIELKWRRSYAPSRPHRGSLKTTPFFTIQLLYA